MSSGNSFWCEFLANSKQFENCSVIVGDGTVYSTHKILLSKFSLLKALLSRDDPLEESVILLPDFSLEEVATAFDFNAKSEAETELMELLSQSVDLPLLKGESVKQEMLQEENKLLVEIRRPGKRGRPPGSGIKTPHKFSKYMNRRGKYQCDRCDKELSNPRLFGQHLAAHNTTEIEEVEEEKDEEEEDKEGGDQTEGEESDVGDSLEDFIVSDDPEDDEPRRKKTNISNLGRSKKPQDSKPKTVRRRRKKKNNEGEKEEEGEEGKFPCEFCPKSFSIQKYLDSHITNKHPDRSEINSLIQEEEGSYRCTLCQKVFTIARRCRYHLKFKHKIGASLQCEVCRKLFYYEYDLRLHLKFHTAPREYVCDLCGKGFLLENLLANHKQNMHSTREEKEKGRRFVCTFCAKGFFSKSALQEHEFLHSEKKNFGCDICGMTFKQSSGLRAHHNRHHSNGGPKPASEEHKEKMRAYMKRYRAIRAGKLPDSINHSYRTAKRGESGGGGRGGEGGGGGGGKSGEDESADIRVEQVLVQQKFLGDSELKREKESLQQQQQQVIQVHKVHHFQPQAFRTLPYME